MQSDYIVTTEMTIKARKPALRVSWSKVVRNKSEEIGTILLAKSTNVAPITKKFLKLAVAKATVASLRSAELQVSVDALDTPFQSALEAAKHVVKDRQIEYINILSKVRHYRSKTIAPKLVIVAHQLTNHFLCNRQNSFLTQRTILLTRFRPPPMSWMVSLNVQPTFSSNVRADSGKLKSMKVTVSR